MVAHVKRDNIKQDLSLGSQLTLTALNMRLNWSLSALTICFIFFSLRKTRKRRQFANISILSTICKIFVIFSKTLSTSFITSGLPPSGAVRVVRDTSLGDDLMRTIRKLPLTLHQSTLLRQLKKRGEREERENMIVVSTLQRP